MPFCVHLRSPVYEVYSIWLVYSGRATLIQFSLLIFFNCASFKSIEPRRRLTNDKVEQRLKITYFGSKKVCLSLACRVD